VKTRYAIRAVERLAEGKEAKKSSDCTCDGRQRENARNNRIGKGQTCNSCTNEWLRREASARGALAGAASLAGFLKLDRKCLSAASATIERRDEEGRNRGLDCMFEGLDGATRG